MTIPEDFPQHFIHARLLVFRACSNQHLCSAQVSVRFQDIKAVLTVVCISTHTLADRFALLQT